MNCRPDCGACCIAPSINTPLPGMPYGKPAGVACVNLNIDTFQCAIWGTEQYPELCRQFEPSAWVCGESREQAIKLIGELEQATQ